MEIDDLFVKSDLDVRDTFCNNQNVLSNVPVLKDVSDYFRTTLYSYFSRIIRLHYESYHQLNLYAPRAIDIIDNCFTSDSYKDIIIYDYQRFGNQNYPELLFKINPSRIKPERMLRFLSSIGNAYKNSTDIDVVYYSLDSLHTYETIIQTAMMSNECLIAKFIYTIDNYFFTAKDCESLSMLFKKLGFFCGISEGDAYCAISDIQNKLIKIKNGEVR